MTHKQNHVAVVCRNEELITRLRKAADNNCLDIGAAWNLLDEAADALEATEKLCQTYYEIAKSRMSLDDFRAICKQRLDI